MATLLTVPTHPLNFIIKGDLDLINASSSDNGTGTIYVRDGGMFVQGLTDLDQTTIDTTDGEFYVFGTNRIIFDITNAIELTATNNSFLKTTAGTATIWSSATDANGKVLIRADGNGDNSILINSTNTTDGQITIQSAGSSTTNNAIRILANDTVDGDILIQGSGNFASNNPSIKLNAPNTTSGQIHISSAGDSTTVDSVLINASGTVGGNVKIVASGSTDPSINLHSTSNSGTILLESNGSALDAIKLNATAGGINVIALDDILINSDAVVSIATLTEGVPVFIGTPTSLTTINGDFIVQGTTTTLNTETLTVKDNLIVLNSGNGELGIDSGLIIRRFQTPNGTSVGDVVSNPTPIQEQGQFQAGSSTPGTLVLAQHASNTLDFYKGWWIKITSGTGDLQVRRIKSYDETTKTATIYITADNVSPTDGPGFTDGLNLATAPSAGDTYQLFNGSHVATYYDESLDFWNFSTLANIPDAISGAGISSANIQQYQNINSGEINIQSKLYNNAFASASANTITFTLLSHGIEVLDRVRVGNSFDLTPAIPDGVYTVLSTPSANTFTISVPSSTTSIISSSASITHLNTSVLKANVIQPLDDDFGGIAIPGITFTEDVIIPKTSTLDYVLTTTKTYGSYFIIVSDLFNTNGAMSTFAVSSSGSGGSVSRISSSKGNENQRIFARWNAGEKVEIFHLPQGSGAGNYTYRVRIFTSI
jgi:hypothetical protein